MERRHEYGTRVRWTGNRGSGTATYRGYEREHEIRSGSRPPIPASSDPAFRGDAERWNPELLFVAALSECHMLQYLHLCAEQGIVVTGYEDDAVGTMVQTDDGGGAFVEVVLAPVVTITEPARLDEATDLHDRAHKLCFIASSVRVPVLHRPTVRAA